MKKNFYSLQTQEVKRLTDSSVSISFEVSEKDRTQFDYSPGQYLTIEAQIDGNPIRRSYSICSAKDEPLQVAVKKIEGGVFSTFANEDLVGGTTLEVMPPMGNFILNIDPKNVHTYVGIATGSGITPIISMIKEVLKNEPHSRFILLYGNRDAESIMFAEDIENLKNKYIDRFSFLHFFSQEERDVEWMDGRISADKIRDFIEKYIDIKFIHSFYLCGAFDMIMEVKDFLEKIDISKEKIHFELFSTQSSKSSKETDAEKRLDTEHTITIEIDGVSSTYIMPSGTTEKSILDFAIEKGVDLPFACKGGVCATCKAKVQEGQVHMKLNYALEQSEVDEGYILTCQCMPVSEDCHINFDDV